MSSAVDDRAPSSFADAVNVAQTEWTAPGGWDVFDSSLTTITEAAQTLGDAALLDVCVLAHGFVMNRATTIAVPDGDCRKRLQSWSDRLLSYLELPGPVSADALVESLVSLGGPGSLDEEDRRLLLEMLRPDTPEEFEETMVLEPESG